jgi:hypothetical protein
LAVVFMVHNSAGTSPMYRFCLAICFGLALVWNLGCGPAQQGAVPTANVKGTVNMDGKPLPTGELHFGMTGVPPSVVQISNGTFSGEAPVGKNQVEVFIYAERGSEKYSGERSKINIAPEKYWGPKTALSATVSASGPNEFKFDITSK